MGFLGVAPRVAPLVAQSAFEQQKCVPGAPKALPIAENCTKTPSKTKKQLRKSALLKVCTYILLDFALVDCRFRSPNVEKLCLFNDFQGE